MADHKLAGTVVITVSAYSKMKKDSGMSGTATLQVGANVGGK